MKKGDIYFWNKNYPPEYKDIKNRHFEVLAVSPTHAYLRNMRMGYRSNIPLETVKKDYIISPMIGRK